MRLMGFLPAIEGAVPEGADGVGAVVVDALRVVVLPSLRSIAHTRSVHPAELAFCSTSLNADIGMLIV